MRYKTRKTRGDGVKFGLSLTRSLGTNRQLFFFTNLLILYVACLGEELAYILCYIDQFTMT